MSCGQRYRIRICTECNGTEPEKTAWRKEAAPCGASAGNRRVAGYVTFAVITALFVVWSLWGTNVVADKAQADALHGFAGSFQGPLTPQFDTPAPIVYGPVQVDAAPEEDLTVFGVVYIPRFGPTYSRPLVQGTDRDALDTLGLGHYVNTAMPGAIGNFAIAGHRQTHGAVLDNIDKLIPGDRIYVQTRTAYYVYVYRNNEIVMPDATGVLSPAPMAPGTEPNQALMTMTSCNPRFGSQERIIAYSILESWQPVSAGPPAGIATQVAALGGS